MSPLKYECIHCHVQWGNLTAGDDNISHGLCRRCVRELQKDKVWKRQYRELVSECYAKGYENCGEIGCAFWKTCLEKNIQEWEEREGINYGKAVGQGKR
jgi:hypothetical protein